MNYINAHGSIKGIVYIQLRRGAKRNELMGVIIYERNWKNALDVLTKYGLDAYWKEVYHLTGINMPIGRVTGQYGRFLKCITTEDEIKTELAGRFSYMIEGVAELPVTGDWVLVMMQKGIDNGLIYDVLPRKSWVARRRSKGYHMEQLLAANVDFLCIVSSLDKTLNMNLIERYMLLAAEGRAPYALRTIKGGTSLLHGNSF